MNFWVITILTVAAVLLLCPTEIFGKKWQKSEEKKTVASSSGGYVKPHEHNTQHENLKTKDVLVRNTRGVETTDNSSPPAADNEGSLAPGKERKHKKIHKKPVDNNNSQSLSSQSLLPPDSTTHQETKRSKNNHRQQQPQQSQKSTRHSKNQKQSNTFDQNNLESSQSSCQYSKGNWSDCNVSTNTRSRISTLVEGDANNCALTKTKQKRCKKAKASHVCIYDKGQWSECTNGETTRTDALRKPASATNGSCEETRTAKKNCAVKKQKKNKKNKSQGRKARAQQQPQQAITGKLPTAKEQTYRKI